MMKRHQTSQHSTTIPCQRKKPSNSLLVDAVKKKSPLDSVQKIIDLGVSLDETDEDGKTALMYAVIYSDLVLSRKLISSGADTINTCESDGFTVLMFAILHLADCDFVEDLLKLGTDVSVQNESGDTALLLACEKGNPDIIKILLNHGANVLDQNRNGRSPLMVATETNCLEIMRTLLSAGADVNFKDDSNETALFKIQTEDSFFLLLQAGANPTFVNKNKESVLFALVSRKPQLLGCIRHLLQTGANPSTADNKGNTPLMKACTDPVCQHLKLVKLLIEKGASPSHFNNNGNCALSHAILLGHLETIKLLLSAGANPSTKDNNGLSLLMLLCCYKSEYLNIFKLLINAGANVSHQNYRKECVLMLAIKNNHINYVKHLLESGANTSAEDEFGNSVLHQVCDSEEENVELLNILLNAGANTSAQNLKGKTALMFAVKHGYFRTIDILLKHCPSVCAQDEDGRNVLMMICYKRNDTKHVKSCIENGINLSARDQEGHTALMIALKNNHFDTAKLLISAGANVSLQDQEGITALIMACEDPSVVNLDQNSVLMNFVKHNPDLLSYNGNNLLIEACKHPSEQLDLVKLLLEQGINPSSENELGLSALSFAISRQHVETIKLLLSSGANPSAHNKKSLSILMQLCLKKVEIMDIFNLLVEAGANLTAREKFGQTALMFAIMRGHTNYIKRLLQLGVNPSAQRRKGTSALMQVCDMDEENLELVNILLEAGASTLSRNVKGETALMVAVKHNHLNIVELLLKNGAKMCAENNCGENVFMLASYDLNGNISLKMINLFLKYGVNLSAQKSYQSSLIDAIFHDDCREIVKLLIETYANISDVFIQDIKGFTLLMWACEMDYIDVVKMFLKKGACIATQNNVGDTAVIIAAELRAFEIMFFLLDSGARSVYKNNSVVYKIFANLIYRKINYQDFKDTLQKVLDYNTEVDSSLILYEMVRSYLNNIYDENAFLDRCCWKLALLSIKQFVEEFSIKLKESNICNLHQSDIHELLMEALASTHKEENGFKFNCTIQLFDIIIKSPFKDVNWCSPVTTCLEPSVFSCINEDFVLCETVGLLIYSCCYEFKILLNSVQNLLNNGFSTHSKDDRFISPLTILMSLALTSHHDEKSFLEIFKLLLNNGVSNCQRLLRFQHEDQISISQQLQLPDALWFAFTNRNLTMLPHLLPYWSAPPLALLLFMPQLRQHFNSGTMEDIDDTLRSVVNKVLPTLVEIGGPLPPGHLFIPTIQTYLETLVVLDNDDAVNVSENFRKLHSCAPPSLKQLCRHVIRGCAQTGDDLPQHLSPLVPPGLRSYLTLMDCNDTEITEET